MDWIGTIGRTHPLWVHLPIGILLLGLLLLWRARLGWKTDNQLLVFIFGLGSVAAILSCISGYALSLAGSDDAELTASHRNGAIFLAIVSVLLWWLLRSGADQRISNGVSLLAAVMVLVTGHLGGSITHGENYLWGNDQSSTIARKPITDLNNAVAYSDVIAPILQEKCVGCHGPNKQKGRLRLDDIAHMLKGGKNGAILVAGNTAKSRMMERILLPPDDEDHMPPKEKPQLSETEVGLIKWWIGSGASATAKIIDLKPDASIIRAITQTEVEAAPEELPAVKQAPPQLVEKLRKQGVVVSPVAQGSNLLYVSLVNCSSISDTLINDLPGLKEQLYWLKAEGPAVNDKLVQGLSSCHQLRYLSLANASITKEAAANLRSMKALKRLNLYGTVLDSLSLK